MALTQMEVSFEDGRAGVSLPFLLPSAMPTLMPISRILTELRLLVQQPCCQVVAQENPPRWEEDLMLTFCSLPACSVTLAVSKPWG